MDDLISRDAVIEILAAMQGRCNTKPAIVQNSQIWQQIKDLPSAQPEFDSGLYVDGFNDGYKQGKIDAQQERKTGKWCKSYADHEAFGVRPFFRYCSCCNEITVHPYKYCPHCGAMMEENDGN